MPYADNTPASEKSIYFDAPIMHIFSSKKKDADPVNDDAGFIAPSPSSKRVSRIQSKTSLRNPSLNDTPDTEADDDAQSVAAAVPGHLPAPAFPEPTPAPAPVQPGAAHEYEEPQQRAPAVEFEEPQSPPTQQLMSSTHQQPQLLPSQQNQSSTFRSTDFATLSPKMGSQRKLTKRREGSTSTSTATDPDSGYDSPSPTNRPRSLLKSNADMQPVPIVWTDGAQHQPDAQDEQGRDYEDVAPPRSRSSMSRRDDGADVRRSQSVRSYRTSGTTRDGQESFRTAPSGRSPSRRRSMTGGSFANGAGTVGPAASAAEEETKLFRARSVTAESSLTKKQRVKLGKAEIKEGKRVAKVIKLEAKAEKQALEQAMRDLAELQKMQKYAVKEESKTNASFGHALRVFHKEELAFFAARAKYERAQADMQAFEDARDAARDHAREATEMLQEKNREIEWLRAQKHADDRERELKLRELSGKSM